MRTLRMPVLLAVATAVALAGATPATAAPAAATAPATSTAATGPVRVVPASAVPAGPRTAAIGVHLTTVDALPIYYGTLELRVTWGFDYNPATNNLRAYTYMWTNSGTTHLQTEPLRLGDRNGVLKDKYVNTQYGLLETETDPVSCHKPSGIYRSRVYFSVRWPDGALQRFVTEILERGASTICV